MSSKIPLVMNGVAWLSLLFQLVFILVLFYFYNSFEFEFAFLFAAITYSLLAKLLRKSFAKKYRQGIALLKDAKFEEAIPCFEQSIELFTQKNWLDKYRFVTLLSASKMSYKEMGLCNIAFCYSQIGKGQFAISYYEKALELNPKNVVATTGLNMLSSHNANS